MFHFVRLLVHWPLLLAVDVLSKLGRTPELRRLYTENLTLKALNEVLRSELHRAQGKRKQLSRRSRVSQVFAYLLTRGNKLLQTSQLGKVQPSKRLLPAVKRRLPDLQLPAYLPNRNSCRSVNAIRSSL